MTDRAGFFASCADILTEMCVYYAAASVFLISGGAWGVPLIWFLLCAAAAAWIFAALLKKPRSTGLLAAVTAGLFAAFMALFVLVSATPLGFGYGVVLAVGGGMAVGMPLYYALNRPQLQRHLTHLDVLLLALLAVMLCREALDISGATVALMTATLFMDAAAAVGLRMSDGGDQNGADAFRAVMIALAGAVGVALVIGLLTVLASRSGDAAAAAISGAGSFFAAIGGQIERFFRWLVSLFAHEEKYEAVPLEGELPSLAAMEGQAAEGSVGVNTTAVGVIAAVLVLAAAAAVIVLLRKKRFTRDAAAAPSPAGGAVRRSGGGENLWRRLMRRLRFRWRAFVLRDTPGGLMIYLERRGKRARKPRQTGETMAHYIRRAAPGGGLEELAGALDRKYYGGGEDTLSPRRCRELRKTIRKAVRHG